MRQIARLTDSVSANTSPSSLLSGPGRRTEPRTTRGFLSWAPDCALGPVARKPVSDARRLKASRLCAPLHGAGETTMVNMSNPPLPGLTLRDDVLPVLGLTVTEAAEQLGVSRVTLSRA